MKKILALFLFASVITLAGCTEAVDYSDQIAELETEIAVLKQQVDEMDEHLEELLNVPEKVVLKVAMITDSGTIDDESFNQGTWEGIVEYCNFNGHLYQYYKPIEVSDTAYLDAISLAVADGATVVVTPGFLFETSVFTAQTMYPEVNFILIDGTPHSGWGSDPHEWLVADNTLSIFFNEHESGFLAGYAAVMDGYRHLGFTGGMAVPAVVKFGIGFVAGAYYAANEEGVSITLGNDDYHYFGDFAPSQEAKDYAAGRFTAGTEVIFSAAGGAGGSVMLAAEEAASDAKVIGVDVDQYYLSDTVITSALKALGVAVKSALEDLEKGTFVGGQEIYLGAADGGVGLPMENSVFASFTVSDYLDILDDVATGAVVVPATYADLVTFLSANGNPTGAPDEATISGS